MVDSDTEKNWWIGPKKKKEKKGWPIPAHTTRVKHLKKYLKKKKEEEEEKSYVGPRGPWKSLSDLLQFIDSQVPWADSTLIIIILFVGNLWDLFFFFFAKYLFFGWMKVENNLE